MAGYYMALPDIQSCDRGVLPDIEMKMDINQLIKGYDPVMEKALQTN